MNQKTMGVRIAIKLYLTDYRIFTHNPSQKIYTNYRNGSLKHFIPHYFTSNLHLTLKDKPAWNSVVSLFQKQQQRKPAGRYQL
jgi:hypothetical protein